MDAPLSALLERGVLSDPWVEGAPRFSFEPVVIEPAEAAALSRAACSAAMVLDEAATALASDPGLAAFVGVAPDLAAVAALDAPSWLGLARADVFFTEEDEGPVVCEVNCDTPTGLAECTELGDLAAAAHPGLRDPSVRLKERWQAYAAAALAAVGRKPAGSVAALVDPTEMTEDLCHVRLLARWLRGMGVEVVRGSPFNLQALDGDRAGLFGRPADLLVRHYKTDWWGGRTSVWLDGPPPPDSLPLARELEVVARAMEAGSLAVINPWGAALAQNKRALALPWERPGLFSPEALAAARAFVPETRFAESVGRERLLVERERWVLKSDYGCEGDEVLLGSLTPPEEWERCVALLAPGRWVAQRAFAPRRDGGGLIRNHGVYLVGGAPSGIYTRRSAGPTDCSALSCPTLVRP